MPLTYRFHRSYDDTFIIYRVPLERWIVFVLRFDMY